MKILSKKDMHRTANPGGFTPGGITPMGGGGGGGYTSGGASPDHQGPPPVMGGPTGTKTCPECSRNFNSGYELRNHLRKEHEVRDSGAK